jgi:RNA polymerase sigma factor FliA
VPQESLEKPLDPNALVLQHLDVVEVVLAHVLATGLRAESDELRAFGRQGLLEAALRFAPERGTEFRAFAYLRVRGAMLDGIGKMGNWSKRGYQVIQMLRAAQATSSAAQEEESSPEQLGPDAAAARLQTHMGRMVSAMTVGLLAEQAFDGGEVVAVDRAAPADEQLEAKQMGQLLASALEELPSEERDVLRRYYLGGECLDDIAATLGCSRSWASRLHTRGVQRLGLRVRSAL